MAFPNAFFTKLAPASFAGGGADDTSRQVFFREKEALKAVPGSSITRSGDGLAAFAAGDVITSAGTGANGVNDNAWYVWRSPDGWEVCKQVTQGTGTGTATTFNTTYVVSGAAGFTGGAAAVRATATDEGIIATNVAYATFANGQTTRRSHWGYVEHVSPYRFLFMLCADDSGQVGYNQTKPWGGWMADSWLQYGLATDDAPLRMHFIQQNSVAQTFSASNNGWLMGAYADAAAPVTSANFRILSIDNVAPIGTTSVIAFDAGGFRTQPFRVRVTVGTNFVLPPPSILQLKDFTETASSQAQGGRLLTTPTQMGGDGVAPSADAIANDMLVYPWDNTNPYSSAVPSQTGRIYPMAPIDGADTFMQYALRYRMRAIDTTLVQTVYWYATSPDPNGTQYTGPGPLTDIVVADILGD